MAEKIKELSFNELPNSVDAEIAVLSSCLQSKDAVDIALNLLRFDDFYKNAHAVIFEHVSRLYYKRSVIDIVTIKQSLEDANKLEGIGGVYYLAELVEKVPATANIEHYCDIVKEKAWLRYSLGISSDIKKAVDENSSSKEILDLINKKSLSLITHQKGGFRPIGEYVQEFCNYLDDNANGKIKRVKTYMNPVDKCIIGMEGGELVLIAARPGAGKTEIGLNIAKKNAEHGNSVGIISLEMKGRSLIGRLMANETRMSKKIFRDAKLTDQQYADVISASARLNSLPIFIEEKAGLDVFEIISRARMLKNMHDIQLLMIDYIQLIKSHNVYLKKHEIFGEIDQALLEFGKDANIPILALAQLNRDVEKGSYRFPQLSDLSESGKLEQDAHIIIFIDRPENSQCFDGQLTVPIKQSGEEIELKKENLTVMGIAKFREGDEKFDKIPLYFDRNVQDFVTIDKYHFDYDVR